jgi:hypothetical protein
MILYITKISGTEYLLSFIIISASFLYTVEILGQRQLSSSNVQFNRPASKEYLS